MDYDPINWYPEQVPMGMQTPTVYVPPSSAPYYPPTTVSYYPPSTALYYPPLTSPPHYSPSTSPQHPEIVITAAFQNCLAAMNQAFSDYDNRFTSEVQKIQDKLRESSLTLGRLTESLSKLPTTETTAPTGPRYAPADPTLPKPWKGLIDGSTGSLYYWNTESNKTQYERPCNQASQCQITPTGPSEPSTIVLEQPEVNSASAKATTDHTVVLSGTATGAALASGPELDHNLVGGNAVQSILKVPIDAKAIDVAQLLPDRTGEPAQLCVVTPIDINTSNSTTFHKFPPQPGGASSIKLRSFVTPPSGSKDSVEPYPSSVVRTAVSLSPASLDYVVLSGTSSEANIDVAAVDKRNCLHLRMGVSTGKIESETDNIDIVMVVDNSDVDAQAMLSRSDGSVVKLNTNEAFQEHIESVGILTEDDDPCPASTIVRQRAMKAASFFNADVGEWNLSIVGRCENKLESFVTVLEKIWDVELASAGNGMKLDSRVRKGVRPAQAIVMCFVDTPSQAQLWQQLIRCFEPCHGGTKSPLNFHGDAFVKLGLVSHITLSLVLTPLNINFQFQLATVLAFPLFGGICMPVIILEYLLGCHNGGHFLFHNHGKDTSSVEAWVNDGNMLVVLGNFAWLLANDYMLAVHEKREHLPHCHQFLLDVENFDQTPVCDYYIKATLLSKNLVEAPTLDFSTHASRTIHFKQFILCLISMSEFLTFGLANLQVCLHNQLVALTGSFDYHLHIANLIGSVTIDAHGLFFLVQSAASVLHCMSVAISLRHEVTAPLSLIAFVDFFTYVVVISSVCKSNVMFTSPAQYIVGVQPENTISSTWAAYHQLKRSANLQNLEKANCKAVALTNSLEMVFHKKLMCMFEFFTFSLCVLFTRAISVLVRLLAFQSYFFIDDCIIIECGVNKLGCVVSFLVETQDNIEDFMQDVAELFTTAAFSRNAYHNCLSCPGMNHELLEGVCQLLNSGLTLEIYSTLWSLHLQALSSGAASTTFYAWIIVLSCSWDSWKNFSIGQGHSKVVTQPQSCCIDDIFASVSSFPDHKKATLAILFFVTMMLLLDATGTIYKRVSKMVLYSTIHSVCIGTNASPAESLHSVQQLWHDFFGFYACAHHHTSSYDAHLVPFVYSQQRKKGYRMPGLHHEDCVLSSHILQHPNDSTPNSIDFIKLHVKMDITGISFLIWVLAIELSNFKGIDASSIHILTYHIGKQMVDWNIIMALMDETRCIIEIFEKSHEMKLVLLVATSAKLAIDDVHTPNPPLLTTVSIQVWYQKVFKVMCHLLQARFSKTHAFGAAARVANSKHLRVKAYRKKTGFFERARDLLLQYDYAHFPENMTSEVSNQTPEDVGLLFSPDRCLVSKAITRFLKLMHQVLNEILNATATYLHLLIALHFSVALTFPVQLRKRNGFLLKSTAGLNSPSH